MRALRIAFLIERLTEPGGSERQCIELARALANMGHQMTVMTVEGSLGVHEDRETDQELSFIRIGASHGALVMGKLHQKLGQAWDMIRLGIAARHLPPGTILVPHHYPAHWASFVATVFTNKRVIWLCNDWMYQALPFRPTPRRLLRILLRAAVVAVDGFIARRCSRVLVLSRLTGEAVRRGYHVRTQVFRTGATGTGTHPRTNGRRTAARRALGIPDTAYVLSCVCILMPHRRVQDVIRALVHLQGPVRRDARFIHLGASPNPHLREQLEALADHAGVSDLVQFWGAVSEAVRHQVLAASDVFLFPVEGQSWGLAPIESMAAGVPTIVSAASGVAEVLRHGREALIYNPGDTQSLAQLLTWLHDSPQEAGRLSAVGHRRWRLRFTWKRAAGRLARELARYEG